MHPKAEIDLIPGNQRAEAELVAVEDFVVLGRAGITQRFGRPTYDGDLGELNRDALQLNQQRIIDRWQRINSDNQRAISYSPKPYRAVRWYNLELENAGCIGH